MQNSDIIAARKASFDRWWDAFGVHLAWSDEMDYETRERIGWHIWGAAAASENERCRRQLEGFSTESGDMHADAISGRS